MTGQKKAGFRSELREWCGKITGEDFDKLDPFQQSQWMTRFYVEQVLRSLNPGQIPDDQSDLDLCYVDGKSDSKVDFIFRTEGHVLLIQTKYRGHGKSEPDAEIDSFAEVVSRIHPDAPQRVQLNARLRDMLSDIDWDKDTFDLQFVTLGRVSEPARHREKQGQRALRFARGIEERVELAVLDESQLNARLRERITAEQGISEEIELKFELPDAGRLPWIVYDDNDGHRSYVGMISAARLRELYDQHKYRLFALNIRNYVGDTRTNKDIVSTAVAEPGSFFFYNNGIAAVATGIEEDIPARSLRCRQFSVVNGAQTLRSLHKAHQSKSDAVRKAIVLLRVTSVKLSGRDDERSFLDNVTKYNNTQNAVRVSDFRSNDAVQKALVRKFKDLYRGGKQVWYKNKRTAERDARKSPIAMDEFAKTVFAFRYGPVDAFGGTSHLFDVGSDGGYAKVFGSDGQVWESPSAEQFEELSATWFLCERVRVETDLARVKMKSELPADLATKVDPALERRWMVFFAVGELLRTKYRRAAGDLTKDLRRLSNPAVTDTDKKVQEVISRFTHSAVRKLIREYAKASTAPGFAHRNWFRADATLSDLRNEIVLADDLDGLPTLFSK
jgi:hypothetical protein